MEQLKGGKREKFKWSEEELKRVEEAGEAFCCLLTNFLLFFDDSWLAISPLN